MPMIEVDFETYKEITRRRPNEQVSEGDVIKAALAMMPDLGAKTLKSEDAWISEGIRFPIGTILEHRFRDGRIVTAQIVPDGVAVNGDIYPGLSPAGAAVTGHQLNGWLFWYVRDQDGRFVAANKLRKGRGSLA